MGDRTQRVKGKAEETKGRLKRETGAATGRPGTEATRRRRRGQGQGQERGRKGTQRGQEGDPLSYSGIVKIWPCQPFSSNRLERLKPCFSYQRTRLGAWAQQSTRRTSAPRS